MLAASATHDHRLVAVEADITEPVHDLDRLSPQADPPQPFDTRVMGTWMDSQRHALKGAFLLWLPAASSAQKTTRRTVLDDLSYFHLADQRWPTARTGPFVPVITTSPSEYIAACIVAFLLLSDSVLNTGSFADTGDSRGFRS